MNAHVSIATPGLGRGADRAADVEWVRAHGLVRTERPELRRLARQFDDLAARAVGCARQADVGAVDPERVHEVEQPLLHLERRIPHRWPLEPVA